MYAAVSLFLAHVAFVTEAADDLPDAATLRKVEEGLKLPPGAASLASYNRYYSYADRDGRKVVVGLLVSAGNFPHEAEQPPSVHIVKNEDEMPLIFDGGCSVVNVVIDPLSPQDAKVWCNGVA